ncbi:MAG: PKD domain-containing protein [Nitrospinota bacterium]|nr:PKD domain-containing protein [Nitrospinota bacterium]MDH5677511.1 PKD domain-containing protein [Nitrospinota bacterium]
MYSLGSFKLPETFLAPVLAALIAAPLFLNGCIGPSGDPEATGEETQVTIGLNFPDGYRYDPDNGALYPPSGEYNAALPSYVTSMVLVISGPDMEDQIYEVDLDTLTVTFTITPGIRTFTIIVTTNIGLTFTDSITIDVVSGGDLNLSFNLNINSPPSGVSATATPSVAQPGDLISLACQASDLDPGDILAYGWTGPGGWTAEGAAATYTIPNYGLYTFTCTVTDGWGGRASAQATVKVPAPPRPPKPEPEPEPGNNPPVISSIQVLDPQSGFPPRSIWAGMFVDIFCVATDPESDPMTYLLKDQFGNIANTHFALGFMAPYIGGCSVPANWDITCQASDGINAPTQKRVTFQVWGGC